jgi:RNase P subunit RPR2
MCPNLNCRKILAVPKECRGKTVRCKSCGTNIRVPAESAPVSRDDKPAAPAA